VATAEGTVQEGWETILARVFARDVADTKADFTRFKIGEGQYDPGPPKEPLPPDATFLDLVSEGEALAGGGTADFNNGSPSVVGVGTSFLADVTPGDWIRPGPTFTLAKPNSAGDPGSEVDEWGQVFDVVDDTHITLTGAYTGSTTLGREVRRADSPLYTFRKDLTDLDVLFSSAVPAITEVLANVLGGEANAVDNPAGTNPQFFELGIFDANGVMVLYMTFPMEEKVLGVQLNHIFELIW
jgi:hypothetical protein